MSIVHPSRWGSALSFGLTGGFMFNRPGAHIPALANFGLHRRPFLSFHILAQHGIHRGLITTAMLAEECQHVGINAEGDLLLRPRPDDRILEEIRAQLTYVRKVDVFVSHRINSRPIRPGWLFRILSVLHDVPFSSRPRKISSASAKSKSRFRMLERFFAFVPLKNY